MMIFICWKQFHCVAKLFRTTLKRVQLFCFFVCLFVVVVVVVAKSP